MRLSTCLCALLLSTCTRPTARPPAAAAPAPAPVPHEDEDACLRRFFAASGLNPYGDPPGTNYLGGTPLFDERTGKRTSLHDYALARHPDLVARCAPAAGKR